MPAEHDVLISFNKFFKKKMIYIATLQDCWAVLTVNSGFCHTLCLSNQPMTQSELICDMQYQPKQTVNSSPEEAGGRRLSDLGS